MLKVILCLATLCAVGFASAQAQLDQSKEGRWIFETIRKLETDGLLNWGTECFGPRRSASRYEAAIDANDLRTRLWEELPPVREHCASLRQALISKDASNTRELLGQLNQDVKAMPKWRRAVDAGSLFTKLYKHEIKDLGIDYTVLSDDFVLLRMQMLELERLAPELLKQTEKTYGEQVLPWRATETGRFVSTRLRRIYDIGIVQEPEDGFGRRPCTPFETAVIINYLVQKATDELGLDSRLREAIDVQTLSRWRESIDIAAQIEPKLRKELASIYVDLNVFEADLVLLRLWLDQLERQVQTKTK